MMGWTEEKMSRHEAAQLGEALKHAGKKMSLTWLVITVRAMIVCKVCSQVQRQEGGVVQGPAGDGRQGWWPGHLCEERHGDTDTKQSEQAVSEG